MPGTGGPHPLPLTPHEGYGVRGDLRSTPNRCERALGYGRAAIDKWLGKWALANGRMAMHECRRRVGWRSRSRYRLYTSRQDVRTVDEVDRFLPSLERNDHRSQEYS